MNCFKTGIKYLVTVLMIFPIGQTKQTLLALLGKYYL